MRWNKPLKDKSSFTLINRIKSWMVRVCKKYSGHIRKSLPQWVDTEVKTDDMVRSMNREALTINWILF
jgi:hypothetical protein